MLDTQNSPAQAMLYAPIICSVGYDYHISYKLGREGGGAISICDRFHQQISHVH